jgi:hypothetical protein
VELVTAQDRLSALNAFVRSWIPSNPTLPGQMAEEDPTIHFFNLCFEAFKKNYSIPNYRPFIQNTLKIIGDIFTYVANLKEDEATRFLTEFTSQISEDEIKACSEGLDLRFESIWNSLRGSLSQQSAQKVIAVCAQEHRKHFVLHSGAEIHLIGVLGSVFNPPSPLDSQAPFIPLPASFVSKMVLNLLRFRPEETASELAKFEYVLRTCYLDATVNAEQLFMEEGGAFAKQCVIGFQANLSDSNFSSFIKSYYQKMTQDFSDDAWEDFCQHPKETQHRVISAALMDALNNPLSRDGTLRKVESIMLPSPSEKRLESLLSSPQWGQSWHSMPNYELTSYLRDISGKLDAEATLYATYLLCTANPPVYHTAYFLRQAYREAGEKQMLLPVSDASKSACDAMLARIDDVLNGFSSDRLPVVFGEIFELSISTQNSSDIRAIIAGDSVLTDRQLKEFLWNCFQYSALFRRNFTHLTAMIRGIIDEYGVVEIVPPVLRDSVIPFKQWGIMKALLPILAVYPKRLCKLFQGLVDAGELVGVGHFLDSIRVDQNLCSALKSIVYISPNTEIERIFADKLSLSIQNRYYAASWAANSDIFKALHQAHPVEMPKNILNFVQHSYFFESLQTVRGLSFGFESVYVQYTLMCGPVTAVGILLQYFDQILPTEHAPSFLSRFVEAYSKTPFFDFGIGAFPKILSDICQSPEGRDAVVNWIDQATPSLGLIRVLGCLKDDFGKEKNWADLVLNSCSNNVGPSQRELLHNAIFLLRHSPTKCSKLAVRRWLNVNGPNGLRAILNTDGVDRLQKMACLEVLRGSDLLLFGVFAERDRLIQQSQVTKPMWEYLLHHPASPYRDKLHLLKPTVWARVKRWLSMP